MSFAAALKDRSSITWRLIRQKACQLVQHPGFKTSEQKDVEQELAMELVQKYPCFDPKRARETTFIARVIDSKVVSLVRNRIAAKRDFRRNAHSLNETVRDLGGDHVERAQILEASSSANHTGQVWRTEEELSQLKQDMDGVMQSLPDDLRALAEMLMEMSEHAVSHELGKSRRQVANDVSRLRSLFEEAGLQDYI